jgi:hypothetical protein
MIAQPHLLLQTTKVSCALIRGCGHVDTHD